MEPLTGPANPIADWFVTWGLRIFFAALFLCALRALFNRTSTKEQAEEELSGDDKEED